MVGLFCSSGFRHEKRDCERVLVDLNKLVREIEREREREREREKRKRQRETDIQTETKSEK